MQLFLIIVFASAIASVGTRSTTRKSYRLEDVVKKTLCPMNVTVNEHPQRVPKYIKFIGCQEPARGAAGTAPQLCAQHSQGCVQLEDYVPVMYLQDDGSYTNATVPVPVGCVCMQRASSEIPDALS